MSRGQDESLTWLTVAQVDPKKEEAEGELQGRSKGQMQKIHFCCAALNMETWIFLICPSMQAFLRLGTSPPCFLGLAQT